ncbi:hypothetical protein D1872_277510 [compost metagenome]
MFFQLFILRLIGLQQTIGLKTAIINRDALEISTVAVPFFTQLIRYHNLIPIVESMSPEPGIPGAIEIVQSTVTLPQPHPESFGAVVAIAVAAIFIGNVPNQKTWMILITFSQLACQFNRIFKIGG